jgi:hypothetical protein
MTLKKALVTIGSVFLLSVLLVVTKVAAYDFVDIPLHIMGGFACSMLATFMIHKAGIGAKPHWFTLIFTIGVVTIISVGWELTELWNLYNFYIPSDLLEAMTVRDTLSDFVNAGLGAAFGWYLFIKKS